LDQPLRLSCRRRGLQTRLRPKVVAVLRERIKAVGVAGGGGIGKGVASDAIGE
jgi:hypothetical protein